MKLLYGPLADEGLQPFDRCIVSDWHIRSDGTVLRQSENPEIISYELTQAGHRLQSHILPHLPAGWEPALALFALPERYVIPLDLHSLPCPLAVLVEDWYFNFDMLAELGPLFDYWIVDSTAVPLLKQAGIEKVCAFPVFALHLARFTAEQDKPIQYDIGFIGNLRTAVHTRRAHYLARLAALSHNWRVGIATERYGADYIRFFRQCRIIFNYSIHGEFNMRCYEALACGRLMLLEAANQETPAYLKPGEDYATYTPESLESTIAYYLAHDAERERIAAQAEKAAWILRAWMIRRRCIGELWTSPTPHLDPKY